MDSSMEYRYLGDTGLRVSCIGYGCMDFNDQSVLDDLLPRVYKHGINFLDCAEIYGDGVVETLLGNSLKKLEAEREDLVITTKFIMGGKTCNRIGLSYKHLNEGMAASLKRMQLDYVDVAFAHRDDPNTPMEEICRGFNALIEDGHAFYWATSEWTADRIMEAFAVCERLGLIRPIADQCEYNLLRRDKMEKDYLNLFDNYRYGTTIWSPLAGGLLTGKYNQEVPGESRLTQESRFSAYFKTYFKDGNVENARPMLREIEAISKDAGCSMSQLALAWCIKNRDVSTAIIGSKKPAQLDENIKALEVVKNITPEIEDRLDKVLNNRPVPGFNWKTQSPNKPRRQTSAR